MGQIANPIVLEKGLKSTFFKAYEAQKPDYLKISTIIDSNSDQEKIGWLGSAPAMREMVDERVPKGLLDFDYTIVNKEYEASIGVRAADIADDKMGQIKVRIKDMAARAASHPNKLIFEALAAGTSTVCYDGQYFFDTDHSEGSSGTQSNDLTGTGTTLAQITTDYIAAEAAMIGFKDDQGEPFISDSSGMNFTVVAPPELKGRFRELQQRTTTGGGDTNVLKGAFDLIISPYLTDADDWYLLYTGGVVKPMIFQDREKPSFDALEANSESGWWRKIYYYGTYARYNVGYGLWQYAVITVN